MTFVIITHVLHIAIQQNYFAYAPYVHEMNIWIQELGEIIIVAPKGSVKKTALNQRFVHKNVKLEAVNSFDLLSVKAILNTFVDVPKISWQIYKAMQKADHIHLRCPGNIGLIGCVVQILFPKKIKTAKYAGNWDPKSKQPWSYRLQKWLLSNTFLTRNMQVLVYGAWGDSSPNVKPFFTATYKEEEKLPIKSKRLEGTIKFVFAGTLSRSKNPLYAIQLIAVLAKRGYQVHLDLYGEGMERELLEKYIREHQLMDAVILKGNQSQLVLTKAYQDSHFVILPSASEGWPKAVAEGMFWGCVPLATAVSCVPYMLDHGRRGVLLEMDLEKDQAQMALLLGDQGDYEEKQKKAADWSRAYTLDVFEKEIGDLLQSN